MGMIGYPMAEERKLMVHYRQQPKTLARLKVLEAEMMELKAEIQRQRDGALNGLLASAGLPAVSWLTEPSRAFKGAIFVTVWAHMGFYMVILLAGLQSIPADLYEAAKMDRASPWRVFTRITLPLLKPVLLVVFILAVIRAVQTFDEIYVLTGGGPGSATTMIVHYIYSTGFAVMPRNYGLAAAASLLLGAVLFGFTALQMRLSRGGRDD